MENSRKIHILAVAPETPQVCHAKLLGRKIHGKILINGQRHIKMLPLAELLIYWIILSSYEQLALAGNQFCYSNGLVNEFDLSRELKFIEDRIIPQTNGVPVPKEGLNCRWNISNDHLDDAVVVLSGFIDKKSPTSRKRRARSADNERMRYQVHCPLSSSEQNYSTISTSTNWTYVQPNMLHVLRMPKRCYLTVSYRLIPEIADVPGLSIRLMEPGFCGLEIVNFNGSCYMSSSATRTLTEELAAMNEQSGIIRLASFRSYIDLRSFVRESQRTRVGSGLNTRIKEPLNLSENLRIGIFYNQRNNKTFYLNRAAGDKCVMAEFEDSDRLNYTLPNTNSSVLCGSLRVVKTPDGDKFLPIIDFTDCNNIQKALMSFSELPGDKCRNCTGFELDCIQHAFSLKDKFHINHGEEDKKVNKYFSLTADWIVCIIFALVLLASVVILLIVHVIRQRNRSTPEKHADGDGSATSQALLNKSTESPKPV